jgi:DHA1 family tetracycline resistance protein-like MFS transporter
MEKISRFLALEGNIRVLAVQTLLGQVGLGMFYVIWQPYLLSTGITLGQLGLVQSLISISTGLGLFVWGYISDNYGRKPVIIACLISRVIAIGFLLVSDSFWAFIGFALFMGLTAMFNMGNPARNAIITESVDSTQRATALSTLIMISQAISTMVATLGGWIALRMGYTPIFYLMVIGDTIGVLVCTRYLKETLEPTENKEKNNLIDTLRHSLAPENELLRLYIALIAMGFSYGVAYSLLYGALTETFGFTTIQLGLMSTAFNLVWAVDSVPLGKLVDRIGRKRGLLMSMAMALVTPIGFLFSTRIEHFIFFYAVSALDIGFWMPSYTSYITETVDSTKRSTVFGKMDAYGKLASLPAPWIAGLLYERVGFYAPMYVQIAVCIGITFLVMGLKEPEPV